MISEPFILKPFPSPEMLPRLTIAGSIGRDPGMLKIDYELRGDLARIALPPRADHPLRRDGLWKETCFELFVGMKGSECYHEVNLSPSGHWNVYAFEGYRLGMREEPAHRTLPFDVEREANRLRLSLQFDLSVIIPDDKEVQLGICAVIRHVKGHSSHWALWHPCPAPDFHCRTSFVLAVQASPRSLR